MTISTSRGTRRIPWRAVFVALIVVLCAQFFNNAPSADAEGNWHFNASERCLMQKINKLRRDEGLRRLRFDKQLGYVARRHAREIARAGTIYHDDNLTEEVTHWRHLGQNTGRGGKCKAMFRSFKQSPEHHANMLDTYRFVGVGTKSKGGYMYVQQVFENKRNPGNVFNKP